MVKSRSWSEVRVECNGGVVTDDVDTSTESRATDEAATTSTSTKYDKESIQPTSSHVDEVV
jgi:hypothetical protein